MTKAVAAVCVAAEGRLMISSIKSDFTKFTRLVFMTSSLLLALAVSVDAVQAESSGLHFQRPGAARAQNERSNKKFRRPGLQRVTSSTAEVIAPTVEPQVTRVVKTVPKPRAVKQVAKRQVATKAKKPVRRAEAVRQQQVVRRDRQVAVASSGRVQYDSNLTADLQLASHGCDICAGDCTCEVGCGCPEPSCGLYEPGCGLAEPSCGCGEPSCGICEPGCGLAEPSCGCGEVGCGSCVARPGPDYWCFPVCLPRFKDLSVWAGVQGFRGPRDFAAPGGVQRSDSNFGFNEGFNLSGRAPLVGLLFPQLSYQLGYRAVQTRLHGTASTAENRSQQFVTAGFFRRVKTGLQAGVAWDLLRDDLDVDTDLHQIRYELSLKSPQGREFGFFGTSSTNSVSILGTNYETVDQYALFYRWAFGNGYESRLWGGSTGDGEGLFGGEFLAPLSNRWTVQSGFNYLIAEEPNGLAGVREESWNIGINMVWHLGKTAKRGYRSPYRPMFSVADNGWMFVDRVQ